MKRLLIGTQYDFSDANIKSVSTVMTSALSGDQLSIDTLNAVIDIQGFSYDLKAFAETIKYGTEIVFYHDGSLVGKFYSASVTRLTRYTFQINAVSAIGILDGLKHNGGMYNGNTFISVLADIIGGYFDFTVADDVKNIGVNNWLPYDSRRNNLHQLLFAYGVVIYKNSAGDMHFQYPETDASIEIPLGKIYNNGSVTFGTPATGVAITEHSFFASSHDQTVTLFTNEDGSGAVDHKLVIFKNPCYALSFGNLTVHESGVNHAVVSGTGTITGKEYSHTTKIVERHRDDMQNVEEHISTVENAYLVNVLNSENVAKRVLSYYSSVSTSNADIVYNNEKIGSRLRYKNPFGDDEEGYLGMMTLNASSFIKANCELIAGYVPSGGGNNFNASALLTQDGNWTVPQGVSMIRLVIGGAGDGGWSGNAGNKGTERSRNETNSSYSFKSHGYHIPAKGGNGGEGGNGGKFLVINVEVTSGQVINFKQGIAGIGAAYNASGSVAGSSGGDSVVTLNGRTYSSAQGTSNPSGYLDIFSGRVFSQKGLVGISGGDSEGVADPDSTNVTIFANIPPVVDRNGNQYYVGSHAVNDNGIISNRYVEVWDRNYGYNNFSTSIGVTGTVRPGSGAAVGSNGLRDDTMSTATGYYDSNTKQVSYNVRGLTGLRGADASIFTENSGEFGSGGFGGNGGGAGGGPSYIAAQLGNQVHYSSNCYFVNGSVGQGGAGSRGGNGANGYLLIYY